MARAVVRAAICPLRGAPRRDAAQVDEALHGWEVEVLGAAGPTWRRVGGGLPFDAERGTNPAVGGPAQAGGLP